MKAVLILPLVALILCAKPKVEVKDGAINGAPIITEICMEETKFKITRIVITPEEIIKGEDIGIQVEGEALENMHIVNLHISTTLNGLEIFVDDKPQEAELEEGDKFTWGYDAHVPTFTPAGSWDVIVTLVTDTGETVSCLKVHWDMEE